MCVKLLQVGRGLAAAASGAPQHGPAAPRWCRGCHFYSAVYLPILSCQQGYFTRVERLASSLKRSTRVRGQTRRQKGCTGPGKDSPLTGSAVQYDVLLVSSPSIPGFLSLSLSSAALSTLVIATLDSEIPVDEEGGT